MVKYIPESLAAPFVVWMMDKGFVPSHKKNDVFLKLEKEVLKISIDKITVKGFEMNLACQKYFLSFCRTYLKKDKHFIDALRMRGALQVAHLNDDEQPILPALRRTPLAAQFNY
ncbi:MULTISPECIES: hypothetical protein [Acinetobacter]|uniref:hypothetical protein n=1 Tax=Acinetobacter TaxID=469 RepID=UPI001F4B8A87|nr:MULTISPECIES: hypothetical protein [Acinetobacter]MCH7379356.1 hypothetical protein [Acinetobacter higginsii]